MADGDTQEQDQGLPQAVRVGAEEAGQAGVQGIGEGNPAFPGARAHGLLSLVDELFQVDLAGPEDDPAGQQPRQLAGVADQGLDVLRHVAHVLGVALLLVAETAVRGFGQEIGQDAEAGERGAQLMHQGGEEARPLLRRLQVGPLLVSHGSARLRIAEGDSRDHARTSHAGATLRRVGSSLPAGAAPARASAPPLRASVPLLRVSLPAPSSGSLRWNGRSRHDRAGSPGE